MRRFLNIASVLLAFMLFATACNIGGDNETFTITGEASGQPTLAQGSQVEGSATSQIAQQAQACTNFKSEQSKASERIEELEAILEDADVTPARKERTRLRLQPVRQRLIDALDGANKAECASSPALDEGICNHREAVRQHLLSEDFQGQGIDFEFEEKHDLDLPGATQAGQGSFATEVTPNNRIEAQPWYNGDTDGAVAVRRFQREAYAKFDQTPGLMEFDNHVGVQFTVPIVANGNTFFGGWDVQPATGVQPDIPEGDVWWLVVDPVTCKVIVELTLRGPCGNPQELPPAPARRKIWVCVYTNSGWVVDDIFEDQYNPQVHKAQNDPNCNPAPPPPPQVGMEWFCNVYTGQPEQHPAGTTESHLKPTWDPACNPAPPPPPSATSTPVPPSATSTPVPPSATSTPVPPSATSTPVPPSATSTPVPTCADLNNGDDRYVGVPPNCTKVSGSSDGNETNQPAPTATHINPAAQATAVAVDPDPEPPIQLEPIEPGLYDPDGNGTIEVEDLPPVTPPLQNQPDRDPEPTPGAFAPGFEDA